MKPITNSYNLKKPLICIFVTVVDTKKCVEVCNFQETIINNGNYAVKAFRLFGKGFNNEDLIPSMVFANNYNVNGAPSILGDYNAIFPYTEENYNKLHSMNVADYKVFLDNNLSRYPKWDEIKGNPAIISIINDAFRHVCDMYPIGDMITMNYDERYECVVETVWDMCMAKLNWESFCKNPDDESAEFMDFQQETMGNVGGKVLELVENRMRNAIVNYYNEDYMEEERQKLVELLNR